MVDDPFRRGEDVRLAINSRMKDLFFIDANGECQPYVCIVCDRFTSKKWSLTKSKTLQGISSFLEVNDTPPILNNSLKMCYKYSGNGKEAWMDKCLLSPRGVYCKRNKTYGFVTCPDCSNDIRSKKFPIHSICNGFYFGSPPKEITDLSDCELAVLSPSTTYGYCFTYIGGQNMKLKGTLGYYKVKIDSIARRIVVANLLARNLNREVVVILDGKMTEGQKKRAMKRSSIRPQKLVDAIKWLIEHNSEWHGIDVNEIEEEINKCHPLVVDNSSVVEPEEENAIEEQDSFSVYFPDGTMTEVYGGKDSATDFKRIVTDAHNKGFDGEILANMSRDFFVNDYRGNTFVLSCILQMPFGRGGSEEIRYDRECTTTVRWSLSEYAEHLSLVSHPTFQKPLFVLKLFNMKIRSNILRTSCQQLHSTLSTINLREAINSDDFQKAAKAHGVGQRAGSAASQQLLRSIDSINKALPHSNGAVKRARQFMEILQQQFGLGGIFLTVTPDDENSFLVLCYSQTDTNGKPIDIASLSDDELKNKAKKRAEVRVHYPGITALNFEYILDIVLEEVIGWDIEKRKPKGTPGLFGIPKAYGGAVEEQGRTSLHVHFIVWLEGWDTYLRNVTCDRQRVRNTAQDVICNVVDNSFSNNLFKFDTKDKKRDIGCVFDHNCTVLNSQARKRPKLVDDQQLRNLRHKDYHLTSNLTMAECPHCDTEWKNEDLVLDFLNYRKDTVPHFPDKSHKLDEMCFGYTKPLHNGKVRKSCIHARYNNHRSCHCKSCFKSSSGSTTNPFASECRMRLPALPQTKTAVEKLSLSDDGDNVVPWFTWKGELIEKEIVQVVPKRSEYDLFQNTCCWPITESKIGGNTNCRVITPGPIGMYTVKYPTKSNQKEEAEPYEDAIGSMKRALDGEAVHESERSESLRLVIRAGFSHNKTNIVGSSMASFLTRRNTRFLFSHSFSFVPLRDLLSALEKGTIASATIKSHEGRRFAESLSLNYLCRPEELKEMNPYEFYTKYEVVKLTCKNKKKKEILRFETNQYFMHPSHVTNTRNEIKELTGLRMRHEEQLPWIYQFAFPDTAYFQANILTCNIEDICEEMETYASLVLALLHNYYCYDDTVINGSHVKKLREIYHLGKLDKYEIFLQNLQDSRANYGRVKPNCDELQARTNAYKQPSLDSDDDDDDDEDKDEELELQGFDLDKVLVEIDREAEAQTNRYNLTRGVISDRFTPEKLDVTNLKCNNPRRGVRSGQNYLSPLTVRNMEEDNVEGSFVLTENNAIFGNSVTDSDNISKKVILNRDQLLKIVFTKNGLVSRLIKFGNEEREELLPEANGSAKSIIKWGRIAGFDDDQQRAFEIFASSFVLTFYNDASQNIYGNGDRTHNTRNQHFNRAKIELLKLSGKLKSTSRNLPNDPRASHLICLLHGPGGSGKSAIMDVLIKYARDFSDYAGETFNEYTIVLTAMSGVAATLINGRTTHKALHLNSDKESIDKNEVERWKCSRLLIVDEISFGSKQQIQKMDKHLRILKDSASLFYGGLDVIFCGDFRQLEPNKSGQTPIYVEQFFEFHNLINCYVELHGLHRFKNDMEWGRLLTRFRNGELTEGDVDIINERVVTCQADVPSDIRYATYTNKDKSLINTGLFTNYCQEFPNNADRVVIFASDLRVRTGSKTFVKKDDVWTTWFFENCSEGNTHTTKFYGRFDPMLMLYYNRPMMINNNIDVPSKIANGTRCFVSQVYLKEEETCSFVLIDGVEVPAVRTCQVERIVLRHETKDNEPLSYFELKPKKHHFKAVVPIPTSYVNSGRSGGRKTEFLHMQGLQFPINCNNATTGHKLQGATVRQLFAYAWSGCRNWVYVVLSRVSQRDGLFLKTKMDKKKLSKYNEIPAELISMIDYFRERKLQKSFTDEEYIDILGEMP